jgi:serine protease Do
MKTKLLCIILTLTSQVLTCWGEQNNTEEYLPQKYRLNGTDTQFAFGSAREMALTATTKLTRNNKLIAMGAIVSADGHILTKASSCVGAREATLSTGEIFKLKIKKRNEALDLALYQIISDRTDFTHVVWHENNSSNDIAWVLSAYPELNEIRVGITSGNPREIGREGGVMGVILGNENNEGVRVSEVVPQAAADKAGLEQGDIIQKVDGRSVKKRDHVAELVRKKDPGDVVKIQILRKKKLKDFNITLGHRSVTFDLFNRNLQMSGPVSKRKDNFPMIIQHDLPLPKEAMGGPLFNVEGKCIGINIARVDRVTVFSLPSKIARIMVNNLQPSN